MLIENDAGLNAAATGGGIRDLDIKVIKGWLPLLSTVSDVEVKIYQVTYYDFENKKYVKSTSNTMYEGKYIGKASGHSFESGVLGGLYLVEISRNGEILKQESVFLEPKDKQAITIYF